MRQHEHSFEEQIAMAVAGVLPDSERSALDDHLAACEACRVRMQEFIEVDSRLIHWGALTGKQP